MALVPQTLEMDLLALSLRMQTSDPPMSIATWCREESLIIDRYIKAALVVGTATGSNAAGPVSSVVTGSLQ